MVIGRSDVRHTQRGHTASQGRYVVWGPRETHLGQRRCAAPTGRKHDRNRTDAGFFRNLLHPRGRPNTAVIRHASKPGARLALPWLRQLLARKPRKLAAVALANKTARIVWAMMTRGEAYRARPLVGAT